MGDSVMPLTTAPPGHSDVLGTLEGVSRDTGLQGLADALEMLRAFAGDDLAGVEAELAGIPRSKDVVGRCLEHLLLLEGKRLRPLCVALAARIGQADRRAVVALATAVELVHSATLLHDDVVDAGTMRRGQPTARVLFGNAASVFAGDWLLIDALRRVQRAQIPEVMDELLATIDEMIRAEALQLEGRGRLTFDEDTYFAIIRGKTATLFRWAMLAGARAGGLDGRIRDALVGYGLELGLAFQIVDDTLDFAGDEARIGKALFTDLKEGKMTFPLLVGADRDPHLAPLVKEAMEEGAEDGDVAQRIRRALEASGALETSHARARQHAARAREHLQRVPAGTARSALELVAEAAVHRSR